MKRFKRWVFNISTGVSLALCLAVAISWIRSYWRQDAIGLWRHGTTISCLSLRGGLSVQSFIASGINLGKSEDGTQCYSRKIPDPKGSWGTEVLSDISRWPEPFPGELGRWGFGFQHTRDPAFLRNSTGFIDTYWAVIPYWAVELIALFPLALFVVPKWYRRTRRAARGLCLVCGYDLRATPERCPECGAIPTAAKGAAT